MLNGVTPERGDNRPDDAILEEIKFLHARRTEDKAKIGANLLEMKARKGHGNFLAWVEAHCPFSQATARRYIAVHESSKTVKLTVLKPSVAYVVAGDSTPPEAREEILTAVVGGEPMPVSRAQEIRHKHIHDRPEPPMPQYPGVPEYATPLASLQPEAGEEEEAVEDMAYRRVADAIYELRSALAALGRDGYTVEDLGRIARRRGEAGGLYEAVGFIDAAV